MALSMALYIVAWRIGNNRGVRKERERVEALQAGGYLRDEKDGADDQGQYTANEITTM
jgi:hypothetical protein